VLERVLTIGEQDFSIVGDTDYLGNMQQVFEPATTSLLKSLCAPESTALDIGANIGLTTIALANNCQAKKILAIEPVSEAFNYLNSNISKHASDRASAINIALGRKRASINMFVNSANLATSFVTEQGQIDELPVQLFTLDELIAEQQLTQLDFVKIDVEGYELEVLAGGIETLQRFKPIVLLEMNHWCLNVFHRISLPEFKETLLSIFPVVYAVSKDDYIDFSDSLATGDIFVRHVFGGEFMDVVAGFDKEAIIAKLNSYLQSSSSDHAASRSASEECKPHDSSGELVEELSAMKQSLSWRITAPLRKINSFLK
jgi:FkbM family methyltransferase